MGVRAQGVLALLLALVASACGASEPREADIFHDEALRASRVVPASEAERTLLTQLDGAAEAPTEVSGFALEATYHAASGRRCRRIQGQAGALLACEFDGSWSFVPTVRPEDGAMP